MNTFDRILTPAAGRRLLLATAVAFASLSAAPAFAAKFGVRVVDPAGTPVVGAAVCIGLEGNYKQFGAHFTSRSGEVIVDVPNVPLVVTVSKNRQAGIRMSEPARGFNLVKEVKLVTGIPGPRCSASSSIADARADAPTLSVNRVDVQQNGSRKVLSPDVENDPSHYRVASSDSIEFARWVPFEGQIALSGELASESRVDLQFRRRVGSSNSLIEVMSDVVTVRLADFALN